MAAMSDDETQGAKGPPVTSAIEGKSNDKTERKLTVLESHGYVLGRTIGAGSYATVKVAESDRHDCQVAVKIVSKFQAPKDYLIKFLPREIQVVKRLKHPHLIRFYQAIETTHRVYIIMEFAENGSLLDIICRNVFIEEPSSRRWFRQLIDAVDYCHERGVVHRDIKCENLLVDRGNNIKLSDFGFARGHMKPKDGVPTLSKTFCGSYAYACPEILRGIPYEPQLSDVWSLGVVLYAMVYGCLPFNDDNYAQLLKQVQSKITFPKNPKVSHACRSLIARILVPQKSRIRISNIREDPWLTIPVVTAQTSTADKSSENLRATTEEKNLNESNPQDLLRNSPLLSATDKVTVKQQATSYAQESRESKRIVVDVVTGGNNSPEEATVEDNVRSMTKKLLKDR